MTDDGTKSFVERKNNMHCYNTLQHSQYEGLFTLISLSSFGLHDYRSDTSIYQKHIFAAKLHMLFSVLKLITLQTLYDKFSLIIKKTNFESL